MIKFSDDYEIKNRIFREPESYSSLIQFSPRVASWEELHYPAVEFKKDKYKIYEEIGNVKHGLSVKALSVPLRLVINNYEKENTIEISLKIFAKNIKKPIEDSLKIII